MDNPDDNALPPELRPEKTNSVENQVGQLLQRISGTSQGGLLKTSRINKPGPSNNDSKDPPSLYLAIKEAVSVLQENHLQISSILSVQEDIQERLKYWQMELAKVIPDNPTDGPTENDPKHPSPKDTNSAATFPCSPDDTGEPG